MPKCLKTRAAKVLGNYAVKYLNGVCFYHTGAEHLYNRPRFVRQNAQSWVGMHRQITEEFVNVLTPVSSGKFAEALEIDRMI